MVEKNAKKERAKEKRVWFDMNTGERIHKDDIHLSRQELKKQLRDELANEEDERDF